MSDTGVIPQRWRHKTCGGIVVFDLSGGYCTKCHAENLEALEDVAQEATMPP